MIEDVKWNPHPACRRPHALWSAPDKEATEHEATALIAALVRLLKPLVVIETGTYEGHTTAAIATALRENGEGLLHTFEVDEARAASASGRFESDPLVSVHAHAVTAEALPEWVDIAFLDSGMRTREADLLIVWPRLTPGGIVLIHDASPLRPPGRVRPPSPYSMFDFATPRGLNVFQKPHA